MARPNPQYTSSPRRFRVWGPFLLLGAIPVVVIIAFFYQTRQQERLTAQTVETRVRSVAFAFGLGTGDRIGAIGNVDGQGADVGQAVRDELRGRIGDVLASETGVRRVDIWAPAVSGRLEVLMGGGSPAAPSASADVAFQAYSLAEPQYTEVGGNMWLGGAPLRDQGGTPRAAATFLISTADAAGLADETRTGLLALLVAAIVLAMLLMARHFVVLSENRVLYATADARNQERAALLGRAIIAQERERRLLAGEIHDRPVQSLSALVTRLQVAELHAERGNIDKVKELIRSFRTAMMQEVGGLRQMMMQLRPPVLEERGLGPALESILRDGLEPHGIEWRLDFSAERPLPQHVEIVLYRLVDEAMRNAVKYADARRVEVRIAERQGVVRARFADDGRGFDPAILPQRLEEGHYGVPSMRERVELGGGRFSLRSGPGRGTTIDIWLPIGETDEEEDMGEVWARVEAEGPPPVEETVG